jgi:hypothetical protein
MAATVYVGLAVTSHNNMTLNTATFDNVSVAWGTGSASASLGFAPGVRLGNEHALGPLRDAGRATEALTIEQLASSESDQKMFLDLAGRVLRPSSTMEAAALDRFFALRAVAPSLEELTGAKVAYRLTSHRPVSDALRADLGWTDPFGKF